MAEKTIIYHTYDGQPQKYCLKCGKLKLLSDFHVSNRNTSGRKSYCKQCASIDKKLYRDKNRNRINAQAREYCSQNKEAIAERAAERYYQDIDKSRQKSRDQHRKRKKREAEYNAKYYKENKRKILERTACYNRANRDKYNGYINTKCANDPQFKLNRRMSSAIYLSLYEGVKAGRHWESLVGYTVNDLIERLEKQFIQGMTWGNYGEWHIDHKIPLSAFNFTKPEHPDFKKAWALKNLQPMWAKENLSKGAKLDKPFQPSLLLEPR